jgi:hypothetical protein
MLNEEIKAPKWINEMSSCKTGTPVLVIGTSQDPAASYEWARSLNKYIVGSHLNTFKGAGHTSLDKGSVCIDVFDDYLINGKTPAKNLVCDE